jgi:hypothetical protein
MYLDSTMAHTFVAAGDEDALVINVATARAPATCKPWSSWPAPASAPSDGGRKEDVGR